MGPWAFDHEGYAFGDVATTMSLRPAKRLTVGTDAYTARFCKPPTGQFACPVQPTNVPQISTSRPRLNSKFLRIAFSFLLYFYWRVLV